ncbi:MAG: site-specific DNA-methyltransferase, partial [Planctomycetes bacterium]|nr:site-specific DNA-methyltransferase [Planctomycetota bacterium]
DPQWDEWKELFHIDEEQKNLFNSGAKNRKERRLAFLKDHPTLVLDTTHFDHDFRDRLLAAFDDLDEMTDGLLIHSENFQALNLLVEKYRERVGCVYIDPPYNSKTTEILYKNTYKHSSWLSLMDNRLGVSKSLAAPDGSHVVAIDENEQEVLGNLLSMHFPGHKKVCVAVVHNKKGIQNDYFSYNHDYAYFCIPPLLSETHGKSIPASEWEYDNLRKWGRESERDTARNCFYPIFVEGDRIVGFGDVCDETFHPKTPNVAFEKSDSKVAVYPVDPQGVERKWRYARDSVEGIRPLLKVHVTSSGEIQIHKAKAEKQVKTVWDDSRYIAGDYGTKWLTDLDLKVKENLYPKSIHTVCDSIFAMSRRDAPVLDYFAGSGTTGHAVISLNQEEGGRRRFILVEMGEYFDTVLMPRIKKVTFSPEWKDGKPVRQATAEEAERGPRIVKVIRLESYEDALNNIAFAGAPPTLYRLDDYVLRYMLEWETKESPTLLNVQQLASPFNYQLLIADGQETREKVVDIPETFAYLLGMRVGKRFCLADGDRRYVVYRGRIDHRQVVVIWRDTAGWEQKDYERDKAFAAARKIAEGADDLFVNGDSVIPGARSLDPVFKGKMFAPLATAGGD